MKAVHVSIFLILVIAMLGVANAGSLALVSNTITTPIDLGQSASYSLIGISGGIAPYTFNAYFTNANVPATNVFTGSNTFTPSASSNEITLEISTDASYTNNVVVTAYNGLPGAGNFLFTNTLTVTGSNTVYGAWTFNAFFADSTGANTISSSNIVTINPSLTTPTISPSNPTIDSGQSVTFSSTWSGGTPDYTAKLYSSNSPEEANVVVTDSGTNTVSSGYSSTFIVNPALGIPSLSSSPSLPSSQGNGNTITFTATSTGGTSPYTYNYIITNTVTGALIANMLFTNVGSTSNSFAWTIPQAYIGNTVQANVIVTDSASTPETTNSAESGILTITYNPPSTPILSNCPSATKLELYQSTSCTASFSGGTSPYTYNWIVANAGNNAIEANSLTVYGENPSDQLPVRITDCPLSIVGFVGVMDGVVNP